MQTSNVSPRTPLKNILVPVGKIIELKWQLHCLTPREPASSQSTQGKQPRCGSVHEMLPWVCGYPAGSVWVHYSLPLLHRRDAALRVSKKGGGAEPPGGRVGEEVKRYTVVVAEYKVGLRGHAIQIPPRQVYYWDCLPVLPLMHCRDALAPQDSCTVFTNSANTADPHFPAANCILKHIKDEAAFKQMFKQLLVGYLFH